MSVVSQSSPFGSVTRTRVLVALRLMGASYARELVRLTGTSLSTVQAAIRSLENDGLVAGRSAGRTRLFELNPRFFAASELRALVDKIAAADRGLQDAIAALRRRPRRTAKAL
jgi:DNA-binding transcriptional ArsR family regulator